jgi:hypothetical protein
VSPRNILATRDSTAGRNAGSTTSRVSTPRTWRSDCAFNRETAAVLAKRTRPAITMKIASGDSSTRSRYRASLSRRVSIASLRARSRRSSSITIRSSASPTWSSSRIPCFSPARAERSGQPPYPPNHQAFGPVPGDRERQQRQQDDQQQIRAQHVIQETDRGSHRQPYYKVQAALADAEGCQAEDPCLAVEVGGGQHRLRRVRGQGLAHCAGGQAFRRSDERTGMAGQQPAVGIDHQRQRTGWQFGTAHHFFQPRQIGDRERDALEHTAGADDGIAIGDRAVPGKTRHAIVAHRESVRIPRVAKPAAVAEVSRSRRRNRTARQPTTRIDISEIQVDGLLADHRRRMGLALAMVAASDITCVGERDQRRPAAGDNRLFAGYRQPKQAPDLALQFPGQEAALLMVREKDHCHRRHEDQQQQHEQPPSKAVADTCQTRSHFPLQRCRGNRRVETCRVRSGSARANPAGLCTPPFHPGWVRVYKLCRPTVQRGAKGRAGRVPRGRVQRLISKTSNSRRSSLPSRSWSALRNARSKPGSATRSSSALM